jgi:conjugal transfer pilus assembly protein TraI
MRGVDHILSSLGLRGATTATADSSSPLTNRSIDTSVYPPVDPGIPVLTIDDVLRPHQDLIDRIKICYGMDRPAFEHDLLSLIRRYAEFVHLLPATPDNYFNGAGGMLRMGLEVAFFSLQGTDAHIFSGRATITSRRHLEPRWRHATFIAGLCCEIHRTLCHVMVTDEHGNEWPPYMLPLSTWLADHQVKRYYLKWRPNAHESRALSVFALPHVVPSEILQYLAKDNVTVVPHMMACISGMAIYRDRNILDDLVHRSVALVIERYLLASADRYGKPQLGAHLERYLLDALRYLASSDPAWNPNGEKSRIWYGSDGLFIVWPNAAIDIRNLLEADQLPGIPKAPETMLEILVAAGILEAQGDGQTVWKIVPPNAKTSFDAVKLSSPGILFAGVTPSPSPLSTALVRAEPRDSIAPQPNSPPSDAPAAQPASPDGMEPQLPLPIDEQALTPVQRSARSAPSNAGDAEPAASTAPRHATLSKPPCAAPKQGELPFPEFKLAAPLRLNPAIRDVLAQIIDTLNDRGSSEVATCATKAGLFIPMIEFERRSTEPSLAMRALAELNMLVQPTGSSGQAQMRDFGGEQRLGIVLRPGFVAGLDPGDFDEADSAGN